MPGPVAYWAKALLIGYSACWANRLRALAGLGSISGLEGVFQLNWASSHAGRLNSRTGIDVSPVPSLNCDRSLHSGTPESDERWLLDNRWLRAAHRIEVTIAPRPSWEGRRNSGWTMYLSGVWHNGTQQSVKLCGHAGQTVQGTSIDTNHTPALSRAA